LNLYIQVENDQAVGNPVLESNLLEVYGMIPENYEPFIRVEQPATTATVVCSYQKVNGLWTDVWQNVDT